MTPQANMESVREAALKLLQQGLASPSEVADLAGVSRQLVRHWLNVSGIDWREARAAALARAWRKTIKS